MRFSDWLSKKGRTREDQGSVSEGKADIGAPVSPHGQIASSEQARAIHRQAKALYESGDYPGAIVLYDRLLEAPPGLVNPYEVRQARAMAYCKVGRFAEAEQELNQLLHVLTSRGAGGPSSPVRYWHLVARYKGDEKKAMDEFLKS